MKTAVIWSNVEYTDIPFGHLYQLDKVGISNVIILLNEDEFKKAHEAKFVVFDDTEPQTIIEHYQSQSNRLKIEVINTGIASTEEEKLDFYLKKHAEEQYKLHLYLCKETIPWVSEELSAKPAIIETTKYSIIPFFTKNTRRQLPLFEAPCSSDQAIKLLQNNLAPCLCYKLDLFDLLHYQWLFNIFVELISLKIKLHKDKSTEFSLQLNNLIKDFNKNIIDLEKAENNFEKTHKKAYSTLNKPHAVTRLHHAKNVKKKELLENNFPKLIGKLVELYDQLALQENLDEGAKDNFTQKNF
ncbi:hypothetical protein DGG96_12625 [Legionella qingyii]|uniref:Uncharacterized protein n=1 Tax=Legionella qingyii TaxID=2184757 RepID=A0A317U3G8_9GAMM|nr:hypothetical protein [Legionella qingyii]PWY55306.1 hypothetical protein DGG96_12625 [Legionella qingyii]RUR22773.1 hypothetical protein ELY20_08615 [Legionella qingyii]RUR23842.1 hypothetical protein ELY16_12645 [Legionella qingyii]